MMKNDKNTNISKRHKKGAAFRTRDEFFKDGVPKKEFIDKPKDFYRVVFVVDTNNLDELAVVKRTSGRNKSKSCEINSNVNIRPCVYIQDSEGNYIKQSNKFVRAKGLDITEIEAERALNKCKYYPDTKEKLSKLKKRKKWIKK